MELGTVRATLDHRKKQMLCLDLLQIILFSEEKCVRVAAGRGAAGSRRYQ